MNSRISAIVAVASTLLALSTVARAGEPELLARIERRAPADLATLRTAGLPVVMETNGGLFLRGSSADLERARALGYATEVLDRIATGADYYTVGLRPDSDRAAVALLGATLWTEENWILLRVPEEPKAQAVLSGARVFFRRLSRTPIDAPRAEAGPAPTPSPPADATALAADPIVQKIVNTVSPAQIDQFWADLTANTPSGTRYTTSQGCRDAAAYCFNKATGSRLAAAYQEWNAADAPNVIATHEGALDPGNVYIVIGHLDDLPSGGLAPGADDNASGSVVVLESARAMSCWAFRNTLKFIHVTGEESGLNGSEAYADDAAARGENILGVINMDMPGWQGDGLPNPEDLDLNFNEASRDLGERFAAAAATYGTGLVVDAFLCPSLNASDHYPFWTHGWKALCGITDNEGYCGHGGNYPYYHTSSDTIANCGDRKLLYGTVRTSVATLAELGSPFKIALDRPVYGCGGVPVDVTLGDRDLNLHASVVETATVAVSSSTEPSPETVVVTERNANTMIFKGAIPTTAGPPVHGDGLLSVAPGDTVTARYTDALDCDGSAGVPYSATAGVDCVAPVISGVATTNVTGQGATVTWTTDEPATGVVHYGTAPPGGSTASDAALVTAHAVALKGLAECTRYTYWVESADAGGNAVADTNGGAYFTFETGKNVTPSYTSVDTPVAIPDNNAAGATSTIHVADTNTVLDVNVTVNITHTYDGDITLYLIGPNGAQSMLALARGGSGDDYTGTLFDDAAATPIGSGSAPFTGTFRPDSPLSVFNGLAAAGDWRLEVVDSASSDAGSIVSWTLHLTYPAGACGPGAAYQSRTQADACLAGGAHSGDGIVDRGEDVTMRITIRNTGTVPLTQVSARLSQGPGTTVTQAVAAYPDIPVGGTAANIAPDFAYAVSPYVLCGTEFPSTLTITSAEGVFIDGFMSRIGMPATQTTDYPSTDVPKSIPDNKESGVTSGVTVPPSSTGPVGDVNVTINITHTYDGDITVYLVGPSGGQVTLAARRGSSGDNFTNTVFDDAAATPIASGSAPFTGTFRPESPLSAFDSFPSSGTWGLKVVDSAASDSGTITGWTLQLTTPADDVCNDCPISAPTGEALGQAWTDKVGQAWQPAPNSSFYRLYRGTETTLPDLVTTAPDACLRLITTETSTGSVLTETPAAGGTFWYLVRAANPAGEGPAGDASAGPRQQQSTGACP
jgi:subtilisin-like proprotein convertase family protein